MNNSAWVVVDLLLNALWQAAVVSAAAWPLARWARRSSVELEHAVWVMALGLCVALPVASVARGAVRSTAGSAVTAQAAAASAMQDGGAMIAAVPEVQTTTPVPMQYAAARVREETQTAAMESGDGPVMQSEDSAARIAAVPAAAAMQAGTLKAGRLKAGEEKLTAWWAEARDAAAIGYTQSMALSARWCLWLAALYLAWVAVGLARLAWMWRRTGVLAARARVMAMSAEMQALWMECRRCFALPRVRLMESEAVSGPVTVGCARTVLLVPPGFFAANAEDEVRAALCHELAHIRRKDFLLNLVYEAALVLMVRHPAAAWVKRRIDESREMACDELAAARLEGRGKYAAALVRLAERIHLGRKNNEREAYALGLFETGSLERRVMNLLRRKMTMNTKRKIVFVSGCALVVMASLGAAFAYHLQVVPKAGGTTTAMLAVAQQTGVANPPEAAPAEPNAAPAPAAAPEAVAPDAPPAGGTPNSPDAPPSPRYTPNSPDAPPVPRVTANSPDAPPVPAVAPVPPVPPQAMVFVGPDGRSIFINQINDAATAEKIRALEKQAKEFEKEAKAKTINSAEMQKRMAELQNGINAKTINSVEFQRQMAELQQQVQSSIRAQREMALAGETLQTVRAAMGNLNAGMDGLDAGMGVTLRPMMMQGGMSGRPTAEGDFEKTLSTSSEVSVSTGSGNIHVHAGSDNQVHVKAHVKVYGEGGADKLKAIVADPPVEQDGNKVEIGDTRNNELYRNVEINYDVTMPKGGTLMANSGSGNVESEGVRNVPRLNTGSGNVIVSGIDGGGMMNSGSGNITVTGEHADGAFRLNTGSGNIILKLQGAGAVTANSGSGNIHAEGVHGVVSAHTGSGNIDVQGNPTGAWTMATPSGNINIHAGSAGFQLSARTMSGNVVIGGSAHVNGTVKRTMADGAVNGGGPAVDAHTISGNVTVD